MGRNEELLIADSYTQMFRYGREWAAACGRGYAWQGSACRQGYVLWTGLKVRNKELGFRNG